MNLFIVFLFIGQTTSQYFNSSYSTHLDSVAIRVRSVPCPDGESSCPDGETCCELSSGQYGCCPIPDAVCCSDHLHCCPSGFTCDIEHGRCQKGFQQINEVVCPGGQMSCDEGETCCQLQSGDYGCCPLPDAVCCSDHSHCYPKNYLCDVEENKCRKGISIPWFEKKDAHRLMMNLTKLHLTTIQCPDETSYCPEETTCCELKSGSYGCCPYRQASCCSDKIHCCGDGYSCDQSGTRCVRNLDSIPSTSILSEILRQSLMLEEQTCPDGITKCSSNATCCPNQDSDPITYSCCSYSRGVCCGRNGSMCCPYKYLCDEKQVTCQLNETRSFDESIFVKCHSTDFACRTNETCCKSADQQYNCCAFSQGVCCDDGQHCCPKNTKCDSNSNGCIQQGKHF